MLPKQFRLRSVKDFKLLFKKGKSFDEKLVFLKVNKNNLESSRFAAVVSLKVSKKAVVRNKIKRRLREIFTENLKNLKGTFDITLTAKPAILEKDYLEIKTTVERLFKKADLI